MKQGGLTYKNFGIWLRRKNIPPPTYTRSGVAYTNTGATVPANTPQYGAGGGVLSEVATTNLLSEATSLIITEAYTTDTLNGTYTFSCQSGSYELSGGTTGTVTASSPQTKAVSSATVTLTPTGNPTFNQIELKGYQTGWVLGGVTRNATSFYTPTTIWNLTEGMFEADLYVNQALLSCSGTIFDFRRTGTRDRITLYNHTNGRFYLDMFGPSGTYGGGISSGAPSAGWHKIRIEYDSTSLLVKLDGATIITVNTPPLPTVVTTAIYLGCESAGNNVNTYMKNVMFGKTKTHLTGIITKDTTFVSALANNLNSKRVAKLS